jgi:hypothetical protein
MQLRRLKLTTATVALLLLASCGGDTAPDIPPPADVPPSEDVLMSTEAGPADMAPLDRGANYLAWMRENVPPEEYDVLRDARKHLLYDEDDGLLFIYIWRIESFNFLNEFRGVKRLQIAECYVPEGVTIPETAALSEVVEMDIFIYGSGAADVFAECPSLPKLEILRINGGTRNKNALPRIDSLTDLTVSAPDALDVIKNNTHITGALCFGVRFLDAVHEDITDLGGVEKFSSIQYLRPPDTVSDLSPVAGCVSLRILDVSRNVNIESLKPLYGLRRLEEISISTQAYKALPEDERERFDPAGNGDANAVHVYDIFEPGEELKVGEYLELSGETIDSLDFLSDYPELKSLSIIDCDIRDGLALPMIDTLTYLAIYDPDAIYIASANTQLAGMLVIGTVVSMREGEQTPPLTDLSGLEAFASLETLVFECPIQGSIEALSGCANLRTLSLGSLYESTAIESLKPLYGLRRLRWLYIYPHVFERLPQEDQERFRNMGGKPYLPILEGRY